MGKGGERCADCSRSTKAARSPAPASDVAFADARSMMSDWGGLSYTQRARLLDEELDELAVAAPVDGELAPAVRTRMEQAFGTSFDGVRVHHDAAAAAAGANALTRDHDIHFAPGMYDPTSRNGLALLAHELTHVVQQRQGGTREQHQRAGDDDTTSDTRPSLEGEREAEAEADDVAERVAAGEPAGPITGRVAAATEQYERRKHPRDRCEEYPPPAEPCAGLTSAKQRERLPAGRGSEPGLDVLAQVLDMPVGDAPGVYLERVKVAACRLDPESAEAARDTFDGRKGSAGKRFGRLSPFSRCAIFHVLDASIAAGVVRRREQEAFEIARKERDAVLQSAMNAATLTYFIDVDPAWGDWTDDLATPPADSLTTTELRGTAIVTTEIIHRQGLWARLESSFETTTRQGTQRLFRKDDGLNPDWFDVTDQALGSDLNPRGTPKGAISVEWNMPLIGQPGSQSNIITDIATEMVISEIPPSLIIPYVKDSILADHFEFTPPGENPVLHWYAIPGRRWSATGERKLNFWINKVVAVAGFGVGAAGTINTVGRTIKQAATHAAREAAKAAQRAAAQAAKRAAEKAAKEAAEKAAKEVAEKAAKEAAERAARKAAERAAKRAAQRAAKRAADRAAKQAADKAAKEGAEQAAMTSAEDVAEKAAKKAAEKPAKEAAAKAAKEGAAEAVEETAEQAAKNAAKLAKGPANNPNPGWGKGQIPCFAAGTLVSTPSGPVPIETLRTGDLIHGYDFEARAVVVTAVQDRVESTTHAWIDLELGDTVLRSTRLHPFWIASQRRWLEAAELRAGMSVTLRDGGERSVTHVTVVEAVAPEATYNLSVERVHNYFAGVPAVLVHNGKGEDVALDAKGYYHYVLREPPPSGKIYYSGRFGGDETVSKVISRHVKSGRYTRPNPAKNIVGDTIEVSEEMTYGACRRMEHETAVTKNTMKSAENPRGNVDFPMSDRKFPRYYAKDAC